MILFNVELFWSVSWKAVRLEKHFDCKVFFADFNWEKKSFVSQLPTEALMNQLI